MRSYRLRWAAGLLLAVGTFLVVLALDVPSSLRRAAAKNLVQRLPLALQQQLASPLSAEFDRRFSELEQLGRQHRVAVRRSDGFMIDEGAYGTLSDRAKRAYAPPQSVSHLMDRISNSAKHVLAVALLMMLFWIFGVFPVPITALLPLVLFPVLQVAHLIHPTFPSYFGVGSRYGHHLIFLFMGTFMLSNAMIRWGLDRRIALYILGIFGSRPSVLILGFILSSAFLSMWISNTATAAMMIPIALAVLEPIEHPQVRRFRTGVLLSVAYAATVGGIGTLVGSPPNGIYAGFVSALAGQSVGFADWMGFGLPFVLLFLPVLWGAQVIRYVPAGLRLPDRSVIEHPGPVSRGEKSVGAVFALMVLLWLTRSPISILGWPGWSSLSVAGHSLGWANDSTVALLGVLLLFGVPVDLTKREFILDLRTGMDISWGTLILFGGGLALGQAIANTGLATWFAEGLNVVSRAGTHLLLLAVATFGSLITEITSNTATATMLMPVLYALGRSLGGQEICLMSTGAVATSLAFMLPIATPPNAVAFGSGQVTMGEMAKAGAILNLLAVLIWWLVASLTLL